MLVVTHLPPSAEKRSFLRNDWQRRAPGCLSVLQVVWGKGWGNVCGNTVKDVWREQHVNIIPNLFLKNQGWYKACNTISDLK